MMFPPRTEPDYEDISWQFNPRNPEEYDRCSCSCHSTPGAVHVMPCCEGGWKLNFLGRSRRLENERNKGNEECK